MEPSSRTWLPSLATVAALTFLAAGAATHHEPPPVAAGPERLAPSSLTDPASPRVLVTKDRPLPDGYVPADLVRPAVPSAPHTLLSRPAAAAAEAMFTAARADGVSIILVSGYRSYSTQAQVHDGHTATLGADAAAALSARPGHSEHQTGWAMDIGDGSGACSFTACFAGQPAAAWAKANAHRYGFIVRYPQGARHITGYDYEPWHLRFIGVKAATDMTSRGISTLEEYLALPAPG